MTDSITLDNVQAWLNSPSEKQKFLGRQYLMTLMPLSRTIETYLYDNEGRPQSFNEFPMLRHIYDKMPPSLLLKCSRKALKSSLISNIITIDMIRWNNFNQMYLAPSERQAKYFSGNYLPPRFKSPKIQTLIPKGLSKDDVFEKKLETTQSSTIITYAKDDAERTRGPATDRNIYDEIQSISYDIIPIVRETTALSDYGWEIFAGTPLTTGNTIHKLWTHSHMHEWATKCTSCNKWNILHETSEPLKMCLKKGYCCEKCSTLLDTSKGLWVTVSGAESVMKGFHLAQPMLPFYNQRANQWAKIYEKVRKLESGEIDMYQVYNEVFGLAYDVGSKPITLEELKELCLLGPVYDENNDLAIYRRRRLNYVVTATGADWGVNAMTSRTTGLCGGIRNDGCIEIWWSKIFHTTDYKEHIRQIAGVANTAQSYVACDAGPDPIRGYDLTELTNVNRCQLVQYVNQRMVHNYKPSPSGKWQDARLQLHRSDCFSLVMRLLKHKQILFPQYDNVEEGFQDILNVFIETTESNGNQHLIYSHLDDEPDDFAHALVYVVVQLLVATNDRRIQGTSSTAMDFE